MGIINLIPNPYKKQEKNMKILSIGNSFSQDAHRYIHDIAKGEGVNIKCVNLYIGGCSLQTHYVNMMGDVQNMPSNSTESLRE